MRWRWDEGRDDNEERKEEMRLEERRADNEMWRWDEGRDDNEKKEDK